MQSCISMIELEFNVKKTKEKYSEHIESIKKPKLFQKIKKRKKKRFYTFGKFANACFTNSAGYS